jgi:hypothetical protein
VVKVRQWYEDSLKEARRQSNLFDPLKIKHDDKTGQMQSKQGTTLPTNDARFAS